LSGGTLISITGLNFPPTFKSVDTFSVKIYGSEATIVYTSRNMIQAYVPTKCPENSGGGGGMTNPPPKRQLQMMGPMVFPVEITIGTGNY
jgi:hypothetical protein